jgi:hypothetical protein
MRYLPVIMKFADFLLCVFYINIGGTHKKSVNHTPRTDHFCHAGDAPAISRNGKQNIGLNPD